MESWTQKNFHQLRDYLKNAHEFFFLSHCSAFGAIDFTIEVIVGVCVREKVKKSLIHEWRQWRLVMNRKWVFLYEIYMKIGEFFFWTIKRFKFKIKLFMRQKTVFNDGKKTFRDENTLLMDEKKNLIWQKCECFFNRRFSMNHFYCNESFSGWE